MSECARALIVHSCCHNIVLNETVVFSTIEDYCPGFKGLIVGKEVLTPPDLERIFGLTGGVSSTNIVLDKNL